MCRAIPSECRACHPLHRPRLLWPCALRAWPCTSTPSPSKPREARAHFFSACCSCPVRPTPSQRSSHGAVARHCWVLALPRHVLLRTCTCTMPSSSRPRARPLRSACFSCRSGTCSPWGLRARFSFGSGTGSSACDAIRPSCTRRRPVRSCLRMRAVCASGRKDAVGLDALRIQAARNKTAGIVSQNSRTDFTSTSPGPSTLPLDSGSALVEAREKKTAQGTASMPATVTLLPLSRAHEFDCLVQAAAGIPSGPSTSSQAPYWPSS